MSDDQYPDVRLGYRACVSCEREHPVQRLQGGWCEQCRGEQEEPDPEEHRLRKRKLYEDTARVLRQLGYPDRAVWYEEHMP